MLTRPVRSRDTSVLTTGSEEGETAGRDAEGWEYDDGGAGHGSNIATRVH